MKKFLLLATLLFFIHFTYATTFTVQVSSNQFSPASINANVGDTIKWEWVSGFHTTTSTSVPDGAATWDEPMTSPNSIFIYKLTKAGTYSYFCSVHPFMTATIDVSEVLPVTLTAFNVTAAGKNASLQWRTANEQNVAFYTIKRSSDGVNFSAIGQVTALNKTGFNTYNFTDNAIAAGDKYVYYYIDIADKDGTRTASAIQSFKNIFAKSGLLRQVSPNPMSGTDHLMLQFYADKPGNIQVQLFDATGASIKQSTMTAVTGINNGHFHTGALAAGTYVLQCTMNSKKETRQIIVH